MTKNRVFIVMVLVGLMALLAACQFDILTGYTVSGKVTDANGVGIAGVKLSFTSLTSTCETANDGSWSMTGLKGSVVVTPVKEGYTFTPATKTVTVAATDVNFTAVPVTPPTYSISGKVTDTSGVGVEGVTVAFDTLEETCQTTADGSWSVGGLSGTVIVTPAKEGYVFTPTSKTVSGADANVDFTADLTDELKIKNLVIKYGECLANADAAGVVALYDDSYFDGTGRFASRQEMIDDLASELDSFGYNVLDVIFVNVTPNADTAEVGFMYDLIITDLEENSSFPFQPYMLFELVKRDNQWLITHDEPYSPEESILQSKCQTLLDALVNNDLASIEPLVTDTARMDGGTYDEFVAYWTAALQNMDVTAFNFTRVEIFRQSIENYVRLDGQVTVVVGGVEEQRDCYFWFQFEEFSGDWLMTLVQLDDFSN